MTNFSDSFFDKIEKKTNVSKETILSLAKKLQDGDLKDESTLTSVIDELSNLTGKEVTEEKKKKIIEAVKNDNIPSNLDKMI